MTSICPPESNCVVQSSIIFRSCKTVDLPLIKPYYPSPTVLLASFVATSILQPICLRPIIRLVRLKGRVSPAKSSTLYTQQIQSNISMLSELNWQPLAEGRRHGRLVMFYKIHYRLVSICIPLTSKFHLQPTCTENNYVCL